MANAGGGNDGGVEEVAIVERDGKTIAYPLRRDTFFQLLRSTAVDIVVNEPARFGAAAVSLGAVVSSTIMNLAEAGSEPFQLSLLGLGGVTFILSTLAPYLKSAEFGKGKAKFETRDRERTARQTISRQLVGAEILSVEDIDPTDEYSDDQETRILSSVLAGYRLLEALLAPSGTLADQEIRLYVESEGRLEPFVATGFQSQGESTWEIGQGAAGISWESEQLVVLTGDDVTSAEHGVTPEQATRLGHLSSVAAAPVFSQGADGGYVVAVLSVASTLETAHVSSDDRLTESVEELETRASEISVALVQLLSMFAEDS